MLRHFNFRSSSRKFIQELFDGVDLTPLCEPDKTSKFARSSQITKEHPMKDGTRAGEKNPIGSRQDELKSFHRKQVRTTSRDAQIRKPSLNMQPQLRIQGFESI
jgi:hypothetical protein